MLIWCCALSFCFWIIVTVNYLHGWLIVRSMIYLGIITGVGICKSGCWCRQGRCKGGIMYRGRINFSGGHRIGRFLPKDRRRRRYCNWCGCLEGYNVGCVVVGGASCGQSEARGCPFDSG